MASLRQLFVLLPVALFAGGAAAALQLGASPILPVILGTTALGCLVGVASSAIVTRRAVASLRRAASGIAEGTLDRLPNPQRFGSLSPLARQLDDIAGAFGEVQTAATTDRMTHVANRHTLLAALFQEVERVARYGRPLSIAFMDLDHFKMVNDTYGHDVGDTVLRGVADVFRQNIRGLDILGRYGGEEFVLVLPETTVDEAAAVAEKLRLLVMKERFSAGAAGEIAVSVSIGVAGGQGQNIHVDQLLRDADAAMYSAKALGRNQTFVFAEVDDDSARIPRSPVSAAGRARAAEVGELGRQAAETALAAVIAPLPHYRGKPSSLIATIAVRMAQKLDLPEQEVERIRMAACLHDIGKVAVPEQILEKPGPLTPEEWQSVVQHPRIGHLIINQVATVRDAGAIILHHHERFSGHGYPYGLRGADIPLGARIVAIADAYDAMIQDRPYRRAIGHAPAVAELRRCATIQFDPELVAIFCTLFGATPPREDPSLLLAVSPLFGSQPDRSARRSASA